MQDSITVKEASIALGVSERQVKRLKKEARKRGAQALIHGNSARPPRSKMPDDVKGNVLRLYREDCKGSHFLHYTLRAIPHRNLLCSPPRFFDGQRLHLAEDAEEIQAAQAGRLKSRAVQKLAAVVHGKALKPLSEPAFVLPPTPPGARKKGDGRFYQPPVSRVFRE
jgi:hypothetical protein